MSDKSPAGAASVPDFLLSPPLSLPLERFNLESDFSRVLLLWGTYNCLLKSNQLIMKGSNEGHNSKHRCQAFIFGSSFHRWFFEEPTWRDFLLSWTDLLLVKFWRGATFFLGETLLSLVGAFSFFSTFSLGFRLITFILVLAASPKKLLNIMAGNKVLNFCHTWTESRFSFPMRSNHAITIIFAFKIITLCHSS